ncbi:MAG: glycosyltransferase family 2 protein [Opitutales bacterium]|nr:glycosyltransferase family 2 protein [Opitutales bacterium]
MTKGIKVPISLLVPCKNEEANLERCLQSVPWVAEVFVVDSNSNDKTSEIAEMHGAKVVQFEYKGGWPKKKNWALENLPFSNEWVLILDADECLPPEAEEEIRSIVTNEKDMHSGYWINRRYFFMGKALKHAYFPNWNLRLFKHKLGRYEKITELSTDSGDHEIHEHVVVEGSTGKLKSIMDHHAFPTIESFVEKHNRYSNWEAIIENEQKEKADSIQHDGVKLKRKLRMVFRKLPFRPTIRFLYVYIWQKGFLDGWPGYVFARLHGQYEFLSVAKAKEVAKSKNESR